MDKELPLTGTGVYYDRFTLAEPVRLTDGTIAPKGTLVKFLQQISEKKILVQIGSSQTQKIIPVNVLFYVESPYFYFDLSIHMDLDEQKETQIRRDVQRIVNDILSKYGDNDDEESEGPTT